MSTGRTRRPRHAAAASKAAPIPTSTSKQFALMNRQSTTLLSPIGDRPTRREALTAIMVTASGAMLPRAVWAQYSDT